MVLSILLSCTVVQDDVLPTTGPLAEPLLQKGTKLAKVTTGLPIQFIVAQEGTLVQITRQVKAPNWNGNIVLDFLEGRFDSDQLEGHLSLKVDGEKSIQGIRLDIVKATLISGTQRRSTDCSAVPAYFGDLADGESEMFPFSMKVAAPVGDETLVIDAVISGLRYEESIPCEIADGAFFQATLGPKGSIIAIGSSSILEMELPNREWRNVYQGEDLRGAIKNADGSWWISVGSQEIRRVDSTGTGAKSFFMDVLELASLGYGLSRDISGRIYTTTEGNNGVQSLSGDIKKLWTAKIEAGVQKFDVANDGTLYLSTQGSTPRDWHVATLMNGGKPQPLIPGGEGKLGSLSRPNAVRLAGRDLYVSELGLDETPEKPGMPGRISQFTQGGEFIRSFGSGGKIANTALSCGSGVGDLLVLPDKRLAAFCTENNRYAMKILRPF